MKRLLALALCCAACHEARPQPRDAIARSDENARVLMDVGARFHPEGAARLGVAGVDEQITDFTPGHDERQRAALRDALSELRKREAAEKDPAVAEDLAILEKAADRQIRGSELEERLEVPYVNAPRFVFGSMRALLDDQIAPARRPAALVRIQKYVPAVELMIAETRDGLAKGKLAPARLEVEEDLRTASFAIEGVRKLLEKYQLDTAAYAPLEAALRKWVEFARTDVLPKARSDFRVPPELYAFGLERYGVEMPPAELAAIAHKGFVEIQQEMQQLTGAQDYRDAIKALKQHPIPDDAVLAHYQKRLAEIEQIIRTEHLVSLPSRPARIRLGTPAENAQQPAPHMNAPRLVGNTGEQGEFVLPMGIAGGPKYDDFNFEAASWTLTAHEARPGHELQFDGMVERGLSIARAVYAANSANIEGWGLYAEAITLPYMPKDGQLISLQLRLQRAARAFLDPELQAGKVTPEQALAFLQREVGLSEAFAKEEVDRFTFRAPGQATSYYYGYLKLLELRKAAEEKLGPRFDQQRFHDAILAQGLLPPDLMKKAVLGAL